MKFLREWAGPVSIIFYNLIPLWLAFSSKQSSFDLAYYYILETAVIGVCAFVMILACMRRRWWVPFWAICFLFLYENVVYVILYILNSMEILELKLVENYSTYDAVRLNYPLELLKQAYRPHSWMYVPLILAGPGLAFVLKHWKKAGDQGMTVKAITGHGFQRMMMLNFAEGLSIGCVVWLQSDKGIAVALAVVKTVYDLWENSPKFNPHNLLGSRYYGRWRVG